jgi:hypothetical protein
MMRDPRYWKGGMPGREAWVARVTAGFRALFNPVEEAGGPTAGVVHVRAYTRVCDGQTEHVDAHTRGAGERGGEGDEPRAVLARPGPHHRRRRRPRIPRWRPYARPSCRLCRIR